MKPQTVSSSRQIALPDVPRLPASRMWRFVRDRYLLLPAGALLAIFWANLWPESYYRFTQPLAFPVNEIGMAFFLALVAQEVLESLMPGGALHTWRRWSMPVVAALGGVLGAAGVFLWYVERVRYELVLSEAWPVACAIDVAAGYYVLKFVGARCAAIAFFLLLAVATDALGLLLVAIRPGAVSPNAFGVLLMLFALGLAAWLNARGVRRFLPYVLLPGTLAWFACYLLGVHPALALVPIVPFLKREPRRAVFEEAAADDEVHHAEHEWNGAVQAVLFLFGLVNAGVLLRWYDTGTVAVMLAALLGRPLGVAAGIAAALVLGLTAPKRLGWREFAVIALATTSGFTFALFFATGVMAVGPALTQIKIGALATAAGAFVTIGTARALGVGRRRAARG